jgi:hypothetical protein
MYGRNLPLGMRESVRAFYSLERPVIESSPAWQEWSQVVKRLKRVKKGSQAGKVQRC